jgi:phosphotransferase system enzyme I (PtsI)
VITVTSDSLDEVIQPQTIGTKPEQILEGIPASPGIAIAYACVVTPDDDTGPDERVLDHDEIEQEVERFRNAVEDAEKILRQIEEMAREDVHDKAVIFEALRMMLRDTALSEAIIRHITEYRSTAHVAIVAEMNRLAAIFMESKDETMRARAEDIRALEAHLIGCLSNRGISHRFHNNSILAMTTITAGDTVVYCRNKAAAFILESGGINSHAAILSRAFNVPMVAGIKGIFKILHQDDLVIVDGYTGRVIVAPEPETVTQYMQRKAELEAVRREMAHLRYLPARTTDNQRIYLAANLDMVDEIEAAIENGAEEIGLLRTEYLVMGRDGDISMEEQLVYYRQIAERAYPLRVTLRAFDIGSDKLVGEIWGRNHNPLDLRGTRLLLARHEIFERQIEAILPASTMKNLRLMLPMVTSVEEMRRAKKVIDEVRSRLRSQGVQFDEKMKVGAMIETPGAALIARWLAAECDFLSLGTNDLTQYTLAVDREDESVAEYYDEMHPAVLHLVRASIVAAQRAGTSITLCGEMGASPLATELLIGLGLRCFSVSPQELGPLKMRVRRISAEAAGEHARIVSRMATAAEVRGYLASDGNTG